MKQIWILLCVMFGWNWPRCSGEDFQKLLIFQFLLLSPLRKRASPSFERNCIPSTPPPSGTSQTCKSMYLILTIKNTYGLWVRISNNFKIIPLLYNKGDKNDPRGTSSISYSMQLIITIKTIYGLWMGISTIFKIHVISKLYNKGGGDDPLDTCLTCKSMNLILTIKDILVYGWGSRPISRYLK